MTRFLELAVVTSVLASMQVACAAERRREPIVPEKNQQASEEMYGQQQMGMQSLNQTPAEQAAAAHDNSVRPVERPERED